MDYSKWDVMSKEVDKEEEEQKEKRREDNRNRYMKDQAEKQKKWKEKKVREKKQKKKKDREARKAKLAAEGHTHDHGDQCCDSGSDVSDVELPPRSCCGYADPEELKKAALKKKEQPQITLEEKNQKKMKAVEATREHGNQLFGEGKYEHAFAVYERGVLIINGAYGMSDEDYDTLTKMECLLDLNMALCQLKLEDFTKCISHCKMAINIDKSNPKAYYRWGQALIEMGEYTEAREKFRKVRELEPSNKECVKQLHKIKKLAQIQKDKAKQWSITMQQKMEERAKVEQEKQIRKQKEEERRLQEEEQVRLMKEQMQQVKLQQEEQHRQQIKQQVKEPTTDTQNTPGRNNTSQETAEFKTAAKEVTEEEEGAAVIKWLTSIKMSRYKDLFIEEGFDSLDTLKHITAEDLMSMGVKRGHSRLISAQVQKL